MQRTHRCFKATNRTVEPHRRHGFPLNVGRAVSAVTEGSRVQVLRSRFLVGKTNLLAPHEASPMDGSDIAYFVGAVFVYYVAERCARERRPCLIISALASGVISSLCQPPSASMIGCGVNPVVDTARALWCLPIPFIRNIPSGSHRRPAAREFRSR